MTDTEDIEGIEDGGDIGGDESTPRSWFKRDRDVVDAERKAMYQRNKDRPSIKKLNDEMGLSDDLYPVMASLEEMDEALTDGKTYADIFNALVYSDAMESALAFLLLVEEQSNTEVKSPEQLLKLAKLGKKAEKDVTSAYYEACEFKYQLALEKILRDGGKYKDLLGLNPEAYGLPDEGEDERKTHVETAIVLYYGFIETAVFRPSVRDVAEELEAPYEVILKASKCMDAKKDTDEIYKDF